MTTLKKHSIIITLAAFILTGCNQGSTNEATDSGNDTTAESDVTMDNGTVTLKIESTDQLGEYLVDSEGRSLYMFLSDSAQVSTCYDTCAEAWPPLITEGEPEAGQGVNASLISTFERRDGQLQVAYNGWPLYYYARDTGAGERKGQDMKGFGAEWYLVTPQGEKAHSKEHE